MADINHTPKQFLVKWKQFRIFLKGFKDDSFLTRGFMLFFILRIIAYNLLVGLLYMHPLVQATLTTAISIFMLTILVWKRPFVETLDTVELACYEFIVLLVNVCILHLAIADHVRAELYETRELFGNIMVYSFLVFTLFGVLFFALKTIAGAVWLFRVFKYMKKHGKVSFSELAKRAIQNQIFNSPAGSETIHIQTNEESQRNKLSEPAHGEESLVTVTINNLSPNHANRLTIGNAPTTIISFKGASTLDLNLERGPSKEFDLNSQIEEKSFGKQIEKPTINLVEVEEGSPTGEDDSTKHALTKVLNLRARRRVVLQKKPVLDVTSSRNQGVQEIIPEPSSLSSIDETKSFLSPKK